MAGEEEVEVVECIMMIFLWRTIITNNNLQIPLISHKSQTPMDLVVLVLIMVAEVLTLVMGVAGALMGEDPMDRDLLAQGAAEDGGVVVAAATMGTIITMNITHMAHLVIVQGRHHRHRISPLAWEGFQEGYVHLLKIMEILNHQ